MRRPACAALVVVACAVLGFGGALAAVRLQRTPPRPAVRVSVPTALTTPGDAPPPVTPPPQGSLALASDLDGTLAAQAAGTVRPIASIAKVMTALAVLQAHPLSSGAPGPVLTMTATDVADWERIVAADGSNLPVTLGESLSERDLLTGLLLPSADNFADTLGRWVSGSDAAFVDLLNARASSMGMAHTHFADASGLSDATVSTAADLVLLAGAALADPALSAIAATREATLSDGTVVANLDSLLGTVPGWLGIKTGSTPQAGGCLLFAARRQPSPEAPAVTVLGAVLGQADLASGLDAARRAVESAFAGYVAVDAGTLRPAVAGRVTTPWGGTTSVRLRGAPTGALTVRSGAVLTLSVETRAVAAPVAGGTAVARVTGRLGSRPPLDWVVETTSRIDGPSFLWRLFSG